jgi:hypothetical protein
LYGPNDSFCGIEFIEDDDDDTGDGDGNDTNHSRQQLDFTPQPQIVQLTTWIGNDLFSLLRESAVRNLYSGGGTSRYSPTAQLRVLILAANKSQLIISSSVR